MALTHMDSAGNPQMVNISGKSETRRIAVAQAEVVFPESTWEAFAETGFSTAKGPVFHTAIIAGTLAAKRTGELIPFCHPVPIEHVAITCEPGDHSVLIRCTVETTAKTGIEMEALAGVSAAALTIYDMVKALGAGISIRHIELRHKHGGKSTFWHPDEPQTDDHE